MLATSSSHLEVSKPSLFGVAAKLQATAENCGMTTCNFVWLWDLPGQNEKSPSNGTAHIWERSHTNFGVN